MAAQTAVELVALAQAAEQTSIRQRAHWYDDEPPAVISVMPDGTWQIDSASEAPSTATMRAELTEAVRPHLALTRALLASTFRIIPTDEGTVFVTWPGAAPGMRPGEHESAEEATRALLDSLLASPDART